MLADMQSADVCEILCQLIAIPSVNPMGRDVSGPDYFEGRMSDWLVEFFTSIGAPHERIEVAPGRANIVSRFDSPGSDFTLLLDAHQDTVPVDGMTIAPFEPVITSDRITGRGSCDVKGGMAAMLTAFRRLFTDRPAAAANVILSCSCDEESTTLGVQDLVRYWSQPDGRCRLLTAPPNAAVIAEPTMLDVVVAHRGVVRFRIRTAGRACHSSDPTQGINAIYRMARVVERLEDYAATLTQSGRRHPLCGGATLSVGRIEGGSSVNIVPDDCAIEIDRRVIPGEDRSTIVTQIQQHISAGLDFEVEFEAPWIESPALSDDDNGPLATALLQHIAQVDGGHSAVGVPYGTHASRISAGGVPSIVFGPGSIDQAHTKDEFIEIAQLQKAAEVYYQICCHPPMSE